MKKNLTRPKKGAHRITREYPPPLTALKGDVRIVKIRQPWAHFVTAGIKDVENRSWCLHADDALPQWFLVASSKSQPTGSMMRDLEGRLRTCHPGGHVLALRYDMHPKEYVYGAILGIAQVARCYNPKEQPASQAPRSVWYNRGDVAWILSNAWEFDTPIPLSEDDKFQTQVRLSERPQYMRRLREELSKLTPRDV